MNRRRYVPITLRFDKFDQKQTNDKNTEQTAYGRTSAQKRGISTLEI